MATPEQEIRRRIASIEEARRLATERGGGDLSPEFERETDEILLKARRALDQLERGEEVSLEPPEPSRTEATRTETEGNPLSGLFSRPEPSETKEQSSNPLAFLFRRGGIRPSTLAQTETRAIERFGEGTGRGFVHPVKGIIPDIGESEGIAGAVGEFVGAGLSFIPLFKGAQAVAKGIGLTKTASLLGRKTVFLRGARTTAGVKGARAAEGAIAFAGFESLSGPIENTPERLAVGLAEGLAFEAAALKVAAVWRARHPKWTYKPVGQTRKEIQDANIFPYALKMERWYSQPGESFNQTAAKLRVIRNQEDQLDIALMNIRKTNQPGGTTVLPEVHMEDVDLVVKRARALGMKTSVHKQADGTFEVMVVDPQKSILRRTTTAQKEGATRKEIVDAALEDFDDLRFEFPEELAGLFGDWSPGVPESVIRAATENPEAYVLSTLFHEIQHHITRAVSLRRGQGRDQVREVFDLTSQVERGQIGEAMQVIKNELKKATQETVTIQQQIVRGRSRKKAEKVARELIENDLDYYHDDFELLSRMSQLMFLDFGRARELAPRASRMIGGLLTREAPQIRGVLSKEAKAVFDRFRSQWIEHLNRTGDDAVNVFTRGKPRFGSDALKAFAKDGFAPGMRVTVEGRPAEYLARQGALGRIRYLDTGKTALKQEFRISKPLFPENVSRQREIIKGVDDMLARKSKGEIDAVPVRLKDDEVQAVQRGVVNTKNFDNAKNFRDWKAGFTEDERAIFNKDITDGERSVMSLKTLDEDMIRSWRVMEARGVDGALFNDEGFMELMLAKRQDALTFSGVMESQAFNRRVNGFIETLPNGDVMSNWRLKPDVNTQIRSWLRAQGTPEEDLDYFLGVVRERLGKRLDDLMDSETKQIKENAKKAASDIDDDLEGVASRSSMKVDDTAPDGTVVLRDSSSDATIGRFSSREAAREFAAKTGHAEEIPTNNLVDIPGGASAGGGGSPPKPQQQMKQGPEDLPYRDLGKGGGIVDALTLFGSLFSPLENIAKVAERKGLGPVYTKIFLPAQRAILEVDRQLADVAREALGGMTISKYLDDMAGTLNRVQSERQEMITRWVEFMSKEEIAASGGLLQRGMTENEIRVAKMVENMGLGDDIPRLMSTNRLIESSLKSEDALRETIRELRRVRRTPESANLLKFFEDLPTFETFDDAANVLGLTDGERKVIKLIKDSFSTSKDDFSIFAVSRYASAKPLKRGFKNGREQFAVENHMTPAELEAGKKIDKLMEFAFKEANLDKKQQIGGYWPHMRTWTQYGYSPGMVPGLPKSSVKWSRSKFRSGELDVYNRDPIQVSYKYVRSLLMNKHFEPLLPGFKKQLKAVEDISPRMKDLMDEYIHELQGRPHASFRKLRRAFENGYEAAMGKKPPRNLIKNSINGLSALAAAAAIPFRPALIARNYYESLQKIAPRTGMSYYFKALKHVTSPKTKKQAFEAAKKAQAVTPTPQKIRKLHASTELFGPSAGKLNYKMERLLEKGFEWYQSADDWGRSIAFHAQRMRIQDKHGAYVKAGGGRGPHLEKFLEEAKILTFDPADVRIAEQQIIDGNIDGAINHLGFTLARETMNRYGHSNHPAGWNSIYGRLLGQFGTWPVQYKDFLLQGVTRGTAKDRAEFAAIHFGTMAGTVAGGAAVDLNLDSWIGFPALAYGGGPFADVLVDLQKTISGSDAERALARRNLYSQVPILGWMETGTPHSIFVPVSYLAGDIQAGIEADTLIEGLLEATGFSVLRPEQKSAFDWITFDR